MGGGKRKFNQAIRFRTFKKKPGIIPKEPEKQTATTEDVNSILELWKQQKKKTEQKTEEQKEH